MTVEYGQKPEFSLSVLFAGSVMNEANQAGHLNESRSLKSIAPEKEIKKGTVLPTDFVVSEFGVKCGRGNDSYSHAGNRRLRTLINQSREAYFKAPCRSQKSIIVLNIVYAIRNRYRTAEGRTDAVGAFVTYDKKAGRWVDIGDVSAREKVGHALRAKPYPKSHLMPSSSDQSTSSSSSYIVERQQAMLAAMAKEEPHSYSPSSDFENTASTATFGATIDNKTIQESNSCNSVSLNRPCAPLLSRQINTTLLSPSLDPTWNLLGDDKILADLDLTFVGSCSSNIIMEGDEDLFASIDILTPQTRTSMYQ